MERFHDPKNLPMALAAEAGELLEVFQWKTTDEVRTGLATDEIAAASEELADILIFLVRLADVLDIDLGDVVDKKIALNAERYPVKLAKGRRYQTRSEAVVSSVILQPAGDPYARAHYADTIATPVPTEQLGRHLGAEDLAAIRRLYGVNQFRRGV